MAAYDFDLFSSQANNRLFGFLIVISPPDDVTVYANKLKNEFYEKYGDYDSRTSKPHITICNFPLLEERQEKVLNSFRKGMSRLTPFPLELNGFGSFSRSNTIHIEVRKSDGLVTLNEFFEEKKRELRLGKNFKAPENHHLTIAKSLDTRSLDSARGDFLERYYKNSFKVDRLKVLRRELRIGQRLKYEDMGDLIFG